MKDEREPRVGSIAWRDLTVPNAEAVRDFYAQAVGWKPSPVSMGEYDDYNMESPHSGEAMAGVCHARGVNAKLPPQWLIYVVVQNVEQSVAGARILSRSLAGAEKGFSAQHHRRPAQDGQQTLLRDQRPGRRPHGVDSEVEVVPRFIRNAIMIAGARILSRSLAGAEKGFSAQHYPPDKTRPVPRSNVRETAPSRSRLGSGQPTGFPVLASRTTSPETSPMYVERSNPCSCPRHRAAHRANRGHPGRGGRSLRVLRLCATRSLVGQSQDGGHGDSQGSQPHTE